MSAENKSDKFISVVLPVFNEASLVENAVLTTINALERDFKRYELILIDDGSIDDSYEIMRSLAATYPSIQVHRNYVNLNQGVSIQRGFVIAKGEYILHNGIDLPLHPDLIKGLVEDMNDYDISVIQRNNYTGATGWRRFVSKVNIALRTILFFRLSSGIRDMNFIQIYRRSELRHFLPLAKSPAFTTPEMIFRLRAHGHKVKVTEVDFSARTVGKGSLGRLHDIIWSIYDMFRFRYLLWAGLERHDKIKETVHEDGL